MATLAVSTISNATSSSSSSAHASTTTNGNPTRTVLGPLTTQFTYPTSCTTNVEDPCITCSGAWQAKACAPVSGSNTLGLQDDPGCWPPRSNDAHIATPTALKGWGIYSPAAQCPHGYTSACTAYGIYNANFAFQFTPLPEEIVVGCCPTSYSCDYSTSFFDLGRSSSLLQTCAHYVTATAYPVVTCDAGTITNFRYQTLPHSTTGPVTDDAVYYSTSGSVVIGVARRATTTTTFSSSSSSSSAYTSGTKVATVSMAVSGVTLYAPLFQLAYQQLDIDAGNLTLPATTAGGIVNNDNGLAGGTIAGIVIGTLVLVSLIVAAAVSCLVWKRRKRQRQRQEERQHQQERKPTDLTGHSISTAELASKDPTAFELPTPTTPHQLTAETPATEVFTEEKPGELSADPAPRPPIYELP